MNSRLFSRQESDGLFGSNTDVKLAAVLLSLVGFGILLSVALVVMRRRTRQADRRSSLPQYEEVVRPSSARSNHRRLRTRPDSNFVIQEKQMLLASSDPLPAQSTLPEIRITFPEETDQSGARQNGRTVIVTVGESTVGFAPYDEKLPAYQQNEVDRFHSLDLDRIGGLKEKEYN